MAEVVCVDGSVLALLPVPKLDRTGVAYETTLRLLRDGLPFGDVGECSGWRLWRTAEQLRALQQEHGPDAFPPGAYDAVLDHGLVEDGDRTVLRRLLPRDRELLCLRARDPDDGNPSGELRLWVREDRTWHEGRDGARGTVVAAGPGGPRRLGGRRHGRAGAAGRPGAAAPARRAGRAGGPRTR